VFLAVRARIGVGEAGAVGRATTCLEEAESGRESSVIHLESRCSLAAQAGCGLVPSLQDGTGGDKKQGLEEEELPI
jgi:hypothetical protein